jgi:hypothetical protein
MRQTALLLLTLLGACAERDQPDVKLSEALPNVIAPPNSHILSREDGDDAVKIRFSSEFAPEAVANYYREELSKAPYTLVSDTRTGTDAYALYAEQPGKPSVWVTITSDGAKGSYVDVAGAKARR